MKNISKVCSLILALLMVALTFAACNSAENGKSAYEIAVENGFEGSVEEWLDSLKGKDGKDGKDGADGVNGADGVDGLNGSDGLDGQNGLNGEEGNSAYEIALENGFKGTVEEWLASLKGDTAEASSKGYIIVTDYLQANTGEDLSDEIQKIINDNPNKTIYFPDGEYIIAKPIATSGNPVNSVSLHLSNYAVLKAASNWSSSEAIVRLGAAEPYNDIYTNGSNYYFYGGIIDGNMVANGIAIESGRETSIRNVSIKHTKIGIHIKRGANSGSSDADIDTVNIVGNYKQDSIGVFVDNAYDNTFTNMRIAGVQVGVRLTGGGNFLRNLHPLFVYRGSLTNAGSIGFDDQSGGNWYDFCYSDEFETGFKMKGSTLSIYDTCFCYWYSQKGTKQIGFHSTGKFNSIISNSKINLAYSGLDCAYIKVATAGGAGKIQNPIVNANNSDDKAYLDYLQGEVIWPK